MATNPNTPIHAIPGSLLPRSFTMAVVGCGPLVTVLWLLSQSGHHWLPADAVGPVLLGALVLWSPLPLSIPALLLQDSRDAALDHYRGLLGSLVRGSRLVPYLMIDAHSPVRAEMTCSVLGFLAAVLVVLAAH